MKLFLAFFLSLALSNHCFADISLSGLQNLNMRLNGAAAPKKASLALAIPASTQGGEQPGPDGIRLIKEEWHSYANPNGTKSHGVLRKYRIEQPEAYAKKQADSTRVGNWLAGAYGGVMAGLVAGAGVYIFKESLAKGLLAGFGTGAAITVLVGYFAGKSEWNSTYGSSLKRAQLSPEFDVWEGNK